MSDRLTEIAEEQRKMGMEGMLADSARAAAAYERLWADIQDAPTLHVGPIEEVATRHAIRYGRFASTLVNGPLTGMRINRRRFEIEEGFSTFTYDGFRRDLPWEVEFEVRIGDDDDYIKVKRIHIGSIVGAGHTHQVATYKIIAPTFVREEDE